MFDRYPVIFDNNDIVINNVNGFIFTNQLNKRIYTEEKRIYTRIRIYRKQPKRMFNYQRLE